MITFPIGGKVNINIDSKHLIKIINRYLLNTKIHIWVFFTVNNKLLLYKK